MLLGVIVRSKAVFKRPRALSQRSLSPTPKRRVSSASVESTSSDGGTSDSSANKREVLSELRDSPPADIEDIVFQYNTSQAKNAGKESKDSSVKASPASETSTPSVASSTGAVISAAAADVTSVPSLEAQKQQLLDLQERARQYILAQTQRKGSATDETQRTKNEKPEGSDVVNVDQQGGESGGIDDDTPYDPEEGLDLDLSEPTTLKPAVTAKPEEPAKPSSLEILVSTLQRLQGAAPSLSALSAVLPSGTTTAARVGPNQASGVTPSAAVSSTSSEVPPTISTGFGVSVASASSILQPITPASHERQSAASPDSASHPTASSGHGPQLSSNAHAQGKPGSLAGRIPLPHVSTGEGSHSTMSSTHGAQFSPSSDQRLHPGPVLDSRPSSDQRVHPGPSLDQRLPGPSSDRRLHPGPSLDQRLQPGPVDQRLQPGHSDQRLQPGPVDQRLQPQTSIDHSLQNINSSDQRHPFGPPSDQRTQPGPSSLQRQQPVPQDNSHRDRWHPSEPPQVTRQLNNVTQDIEQYSGLRPEERARLAAHESRLGSRENYEHYDQRMMDERHRPGWYNDPRYRRDSRDSRDDSRRNWRDNYRHGRTWYSDEQRQDGHEHPPRQPRTSAEADTNIRRDRYEHPPRHEDRREERRFKEHWNRDRWRR